MMGRFRNAYIFALIFIICKAQNSVNSEDLKSGPEISVEDEAKSGAHAESFVSSDGGYAISESNADAVSGSSLAQSSASLGGFGSNSAKASAHSNMGSEQYIDSYGLKELSLMKPVLQGLSSNKASAQSVAQINAMNNLYDRSKPGVQLSPYSLESSFQMPTDSISHINNGRYYYNGSPSNYNLGSSSSQSEAQALLNMYEGSQDNIYLNPSYQGNQYPLGLYNLPDSSQAQVKNKAFIKDVLNKYNPVLSTYMREKPPGFNLYQIEYPENVKQNSVQSLSKAQAVLNTNGGGYNPEMNGYQQMSYNPGLSISQSEAQALADVNYNSGLNPYVSVTGYPRYLKSNPSKEFAEAQAMINGAGGGYSSGYNLYRPIIREQLQAELLGIDNNVIDPYGAGIYLKKKPYSYQYGPNTGQVQPEAVSSGYGNTGGLIYDQEQNAHASAEAQFLAGGSGLATANSQALSSGATGYSRLIPSHEYIMPHLIPGMEAAIVCISVGDLYNLWLPVHECLVCVCVIKAGILIPVCTRCDGCKAQTLESVTVTEPELTEITLKPPVRNEVTCSPLPNWQSFENPLNPCQICICKEILNKYGVLEAEIDCTKNQDCVLPPDTPLLPHIPDEVPMPLPVCEKFPQNVLFPHPTDECKLCKCEGEMTQQGLLEPRITCIPDLQCKPEIVTISKVKPYEDLITPEPLLPIPVEPVPFPNVIFTPEPLPRPLVTTLSPIGPGPLPGPPPHESCRPFQPGQTFQHPWDECQVCVCTEARDLGLVTIEINCYTKKSCCYETSNEPDSPDSPAVYYTTPSVQIIDKLCEFKTFGAEFVHPQDNCKVCICELFGGVVKPSCKPAQKPECLLPYFPASSSEMTEAQALAISQANTLPSFQPSTNIALQYPLFELSNVGTLDLQTKDHEKLIQTPLTNEPLNINKYLGYSESDLNDLSGYHSQQGYQEDLIHRLNQNPAGSIDNEAKTNTYSDVNQYQISLSLPGINQFKQILSYPVTESATLQTDASLLGLDHKNYYPGYQVLHPFWTGTKGQKNSLTGYNKLYNLGSISDQVNSLVNMNAQPSGSEGGSFYQGIPASNIYPTFYSRPSYEIAPGQFGFEDLPAQTQSMAQGFGSQSLARANTARVNTKSGEVDNEIEAVDNL